MIINGDYKGKERKLKFYAFRFPLNIEYMQTKCSIMSCHKICCNNFLFPSRSNMHIHKKIKVIHKNRKNGHKIGGLTRTHDKNA